MSPEGIGTVGLIGLGNMGRPMAARMIAAGLKVRGFDLRESARDDLAAAGGTAVGSAAEAAAGSGAVILMLPDSRAVESVLGSEALLSAVGPQSVVVDMGSSEPARTQAVGRRLAERGIRLVDAPVSGGVPRAVIGQLSIMVGGDDADVEAVRPVLETMGTIFRTGPLGSGHAVKALNNLMSAVHLLATSEAMVVGERFGIEPGAMLKIVNASSGRSGSSETKWPNFVLTERYDSGFSLQLMLKDMRTAVRLAEAVGGRIELGERAVALWADAAELLPATADHTEIARWVRASPGVP